VPVTELRHGRVVAHSAQVVLAGRYPTVLGVEQLFARSRHDEEIVFLDRLCRTIHALNFVGRTSETTGERDADSPLLLLDVSPRHLLAVHDHGTVFEAILGLVDLAPAQVIITIDPERSELSTLRSAFRNFQARGFLLALDHFGRGSSNWDRLRALEPNFVRLDAEPLSTFERDPRVRDALPWLVSLARSCGARVILPDVDDEARLDWARTSGIDWVQGGAAPARTSDRPKGHGSERPSARPAAAYAQFADPDETTRVDAVPFR
jgi:EAL domain-containing protein (putative c-di-GMP-specific phosphodiesterase class I)